MNEEPFLDHLTLPEKELLLQALKLVGEEIYRSKDTDGIAVAAQRLKTMQGVLVKLGLCTAAAFRDT